MKRLSILIFLLLFFLSNVSASSCWIGNYGESFEDVLATSDGRVFAVGNSVLSVNLRGEPLWAITTARRDVEIHRIAFTSEKDLVVAGKGFIAKFSQTGDLLWMKKLNAMDIATTPNGEIIFVSGNMLVSLTPEGQIKWVKKAMKQNQSSLEFSGVTASEDKIFVVGYTFAPGEDHNAWIGAFDFEGNVLWQRAINLGYDEFADKVDVSNVSAVVAGVSGSQHAPWIGEYFVIKLDREGDLIWAREFLPLNLSEKISESIFWSIKINDVDCNLNGQCLIGGNFVTLLLDESGGLSWAKGFSSNGVALTDSLAISAKNVILAFPVNGSESIGRDVQVVFSEISPKLSHQNLSSKMLPLPLKMLPSILFH
ncbi:hypothetical protein [Thermococcus litoralis]|uniref:hypothetical protein n=1 Tax=Thermococcus litoralis TaxID=2265 RepID=UPI000B358D99|nr:hypothetical protein [Thermococcus litoralis]